MCADTPQSNQIMVVAFQSVKLAQASFIQKKKNVAKCFFDICNTECHLSITDIKKHFAKFDSFVKMKLVPTVQAETPQP